MSSYHNTDKYSSNRRILFDHLVDTATCRGAFANDSISLEMHLRRGDPIPDRLKPGAMILALPKIARDTLAKLTSADVEKHGGMRYGQ